MRAWDSKEEIEEIWATSKGKYMPASEYMGVDPLISLPFIYAYPLSPTQHPTLDGPIKTLSGRML